MKIDLVPELPLSGDYQNIATAMDVFSRFLLAYPKTNQDAKLVARVKLNIVTKHAYMLATIISDEGSAFYRICTEWIYYILVCGLFGSTDSGKWSQLQQPNCSLWQSEARLDKSFQLKRTKPTTQLFKKSGNDGDSTKKSTKNGTTQQQG